MIAPIKTTPTLPRFGTEDETQRLYLSKLLGATGSGGTGPTGPTGPTGATGAGVTGATGPTGATGTVKYFPLPIYSGNISTAFDATTKALCGSIDFNPADAKYGLSGTSTVNFIILLETTNPGISANGELFLMKPTTGSPAIIATVTPTFQTTATSLSVATGIINTSRAGIYVARAWITTANGNDYATVTGALLQVIP